MQTLVLGAMPSGATPQTHVAAGQWCFLGQEAAFPNWDGFSPNSEGTQTETFRFLDDPFSDIAKKEKAVRTTQSETCRLSTFLAQEIAGEKHTLFSEKFWQMVFGPFLYFFAYAMLDRQARVDDLIAAYGDKKLCVELLPKNCSFHFKNTHEFLTHGLHNRDINHYLFSRILENNAPATWELVYLPARKLYQYTDAPKPALRMRVRACISRCLRGLPFPRYKWFTLWQALFLSLAVFTNKTKNKDTSYALFMAGEPFTWKFLVHDMLAACLPQDIRQGIAACIHAPLSPRTSLRGASASITEDDLYRIKLAHHEERGGRLFFAQHGSNYGNLRFHDVAHFEYCHHAFFSWGWKQYFSFSKNIVPLPHPALASLCNKHAEQVPQLILAGTSLNAYISGTHSLPQGKELLEYRASKVRFLQCAETLLRDVKTEVAIGYRPYFSRPGEMEDLAYVQRFLPHVQVVGGDFTAAFLQCRLLVLDHCGTTLHLALAANTPTIGFWRRDQWLMDAPSNAALDVLQEAGIVQGTPEEAAQHAAKIWDDVPAWWQSDVVQKARKNWLEQYAQVGDSAEAPWSRWTLARRWYAALRAL